MKRGHISPRGIALATVLTILVDGLALPAHAQTPEYDLFIQGSPAQAGDVTPNTGSHRICANSSVTLTANALPGYQFAYWLGDVSDPAAQRTSILVNEPKVVIAVFHPEPIKRLDDQLGSAGGGGADMLALTPTDLSAPGWSPPSGGARGDTRIVPVIIPVVIPEPATAAVLTIGILLLRRRSP